MFKHKFNDRKLFSQWTKFLILFSICFTQVASAGETAVIILAAGRGSRMGSETDPNKVLRLVNGKSMIMRIMGSVRDALPTSPIAIIVGHGKQGVINKVNESYGHDQNLLFIEQEALNGTGGAVERAMRDEHFDALLQAQGVSQVLVLLGDLPLLSKKLLKKVTLPLTHGTALRMTTTNMGGKFPPAYGRVIRSEDGRILRVVEYKDATPEEKAIKEVSASTFLFGAEFLRKVLFEIPENLNTPNREKYLTDVVGIAEKSGAKIEGFFVKNNRKLLSANSPGELDDLTEAAQAKEGVFEQK